MKNYKKPDIEVLDLELEAHCLTGSTTTGVSDDPVTGGEEYDG